MSTPLDRLKEAFPESKGWVCDVRHTQHIESPTIRFYAEALNGNLSIIMRGRDSADAAVDACIAKAREVGINSDAEAHADRLAEALRGVMQYAYHCDKHDLNGFSDYGGPEDIDRARSALAAHEERRAKPEHRSDARRGKA